MSTERIAVHGGDLPCALAGDPNANAPALVLLHGWTLDHRMWAPQLAALGSERFVLAPDRRGFGGASAPPDLAREAEDIITLLDHFLLPRAVILGMSQAGRVALDLAQRFPRSVSALILQGAPASRVTPGPAADETIPIVEYANLGREGRLEEMKRRWRDHPLMRAHAPNAARIADQILADYPGRDLAAVSYLRDLESQDFARITAPALVITGDRDTPWRRRAGDALAHALPNAQRLEIENAGHLCNLDQPEAFNDALRNFLTPVDA